MKLIVGLDSLTIRTENEQDEAYLRDTIGVSGFARDPDPKLEVDRIGGMTKVIGLIIRKATK